MEKINRRQMLKAAPLVFLGGCLGKEKRDGSEDGNGNGNSKGDNTSGSNNGGDGNGDGNENGDSSGNRSNGEGKDDGGIWEGFYSYGFETSSFSPCGVDEKWWVVGSQNLTERYMNLSVEDYEEVYVRLRVERSERGKYGHLGEYQREFSVTEVVEIRKKKKEDC